MEIAAFCGETRRYSRKIDVGSEGKLAKRNRQSFLEGSFILIAGVIIVKIIGALFKIPLTDIISADGMGYFSSAYVVFNLIQTVANRWFPCGPLSKDGWRRNVVTFHR